MIIKPKLKRSWVLGSECQGALLPVTFRALSTDEGTVRNIQMIILRGLEGRACVCVCVFWEEQDRDKEGQVSTFLAIKGRRAQM